MANDDTKAGPIREAGELLRQVTDLIDRYEAEGEVRVAIDVGPFERVLKFRIELPKRAE